MKRELKVEGSCEDWRLGSWEVGMFRGWGVLGG